MRRNRRRFTIWRLKRLFNRFLSMVVLMSLGAATALALHPLLPNEFTKYVEEWWDDAFTQDIPPLQAFGPIATPTTPQSTVTPSRRATPTPVVIPVAPPTEVTPLSTPTPSQNVTTLEDRRAYLLGLINKDRASFGLSPVALGSNSAAQEHAEEMLEYSYLSHWGLDGLTPYMRYTLAGGVNYEGENASGIASPTALDLRYATISPRQRLKETQQDWMESPGHRTNILKPQHKKVNLGIACNRTTCAVVQQFEGNYIDFNELPTIRAGVLTLDANLSDGFQLSSIQVWYDSPPHPLTLGQLDRTYSYNIGETPVAFLRPPPPRSSFYPKTHDVFTWESSSSPYDVPSDLSRLPQGSFSPRTRLTKSHPITWITTDTWQVNGGAFSVRANLTEILAEQGAGVYTVLVWGTEGGEDVLLSKYSIFLLDE